MPYCFAVPCCPMLSCTVLCCALLCWPFLCCAVLYCAGLCCAVEASGVLCVGVHCGAVRCLTLKSCALWLRSSPYFAVYATVASVVWCRTSRDQTSLNLLFVLINYALFLGGNPYEGMTGEEVFNFVASGQRMCRTSAMSSELYVIARYSLPQEKVISIKKWLRLRYVLLLVILYHAKGPNPMLWLANIPARDYPPVHNSEKKKLCFLR